jgi:cephalosporin hydroxylase
MTLFVDNHKNSLTLDDLIVLWQNRIANKSKYFGILTHKDPADAWVYQEIIFEKQPTVIIEIGNYFGGSTLMFAHWLDQIGNGRVIAVDIDHERIDPLAKSHPRITWIQGDGWECASQVKQLLKHDDKVMVVEDSSHHCEQCYGVLQSYHSMVTSGQYMIVEDGICNHGLPWIPFPGPYEAVEQFLSTNNDFVIDRSREDFLLTWNPKGFLLKT